MTFWVQHGYGKGDKLRRLYEHPSVSGAVLSPADERAETLAATAADALGAGWRVAVDPQSYVYSIPDSKETRHDEHGLAFQPMSWAPNPEDIEAIVRAVTRLNAELETSFTIGPTPLQASFEDRWSTAALQYARAGLGQADRPFYASIVVGVEGFASWDAISSWLDEFTKSDFAGVYLAVAQPERQYPPRWRADQLANVLRLVHRLAAINQYEVLWGYSDIEGVLGVAAGASGTASGWYYTLRSFAASKWQPSSGGSQPPPRVFADGLLSPLEAASEGQQAARSSVGTHVIEDEVTWEFIANSPESWGLTHAWEQHMSELASTVGRVAATAPGTTEACDEVDHMLQEATSLLGQLEAERLALNSVHRNRLETFSQALQTFRSEERI